VICSLHERLVTQDFAVLVTDGGVFALERVER